jgi:hypothetical protein
MFLFCECKVSRYFYPTQIFGNEFVLK